MTFHPRHWCQLGGEQAKLIHIDDQGLAYVVQSRPIVADLDAKLTAGGDASELLAAWGRIPWSNLQWFEWSSSLAVRFRYEVPGHGSHEASFLVRSSAEREIIASAITEASGLSPSERARSASELAKGALGGSGHRAGVGGRSLHSARRHGGGQWAHRRAGRAGHVACEPARAGGDRRAHQPGGGRRYACAAAAAPNSAAGVAPVAGLGGVAGSEYGIRGAACRRRAGARRTPQHRRRRPRSARKS